MHIAFTRARCKRTSRVRKNASRASQWTALIQAIIEIGSPARILFACCLLFYARVRSRSRKVFIPERKNPQSLVAFASIISTSLVFRAHLSRTDIDPSQIRSFVRAECRLDTSMSFSRVFFPHRGNEERHSAYRAELRLTRLSLRCVMNVRKVQERRDIYFSTLRSTAARARAR